MTKNIGSTDRNLRFAAAGVMVVAGYLSSGTLSTVLLALGLVAVGTAFIGFCPAYTLLKINTNKDGNA